MIHFADLTSPQAGALLEGDRTVVLLLPVDATEPHGPHAPLGTDSLISLGICERAAKALEDDTSVRALVLPAIPYGVTRYAAAFAGAVGITEATLAALLRDLLDSLAEQGFPHVVIVNSHFEPEHVAVLRAAAERDGVAHLDLVRRRNAERLTDEFRRGSGHAGRYETSLVLADNPQLVDAERMRALPAHEVDMPAGIAAGRTDFEALGMDAAYCGAPAEASAAEGEQTFATLTEMLVELIREVATT